MSRIEAIERALRRIRKGWCQGALARGALGQPVSPSGPLAVQWSLLGSLMAEPYSGFVDLLMLINGGKQEVVSVHDWNNAPERTQADVIRILEDLLKQAKAN